MGKIFIESNDKIKIEIYVDYSGRFARGIVVPEEASILINPIFGKTVEERREVYAKTKKMFDEAVAKPTTKKEWTEWKYWDFSLRSKLEKMAEKEDPVTREITYDLNMLRDLKIKYLLLDWSFVDEEGKKIPLKRVIDPQTKDEVLDEASFKRVMSMSPSVLIAFLGELNRNLYISSEEDKNFFLKSSEKEDK